MRASSLFDCDFDLSILSRRSPCGLHCALTIAILRILFKTVHLHFVMIVCAVLRCLFWIEWLDCWHDFVSSCIAFFFFSSQVFISRLLCIYFFAILYHMHLYLSPTRLAVLFFVLGSYTLINRIMLHVRYFVATYGAPARVVLAGVYFGSSTLVCCHNFIRATLSASIVIFVASCINLVLIRVFCFRNYLLLAVICISWVFSCRFFVFECSCAASTAL